MWRVVATLPDGHAVSREFDSFLVAKLWELGMWANGYQTSPPQPVLKAVS